MSVIQNNLLMTPEGYQISRSVRLRSSASAYFNRTQSTPTSSQKATWSFWYKRGKTNTLYDTLYAGSAGSAATGDLFGILNNSGGQFRMFFKGGTDGDLITTQLFRDFSAWYHIVLAVDTTQATASNRLKLYVNGVQVTAFATASYPSLNYNMTQFFANGNANRIGYNPDTSEYLDGYLTEYYGIDGQALTPSSFGETDAVTGVWKPKKYAGTYGTNGFYLNFSDNSNNTATTIGKDSSGNGNNWTPNNISVTSGVTYDSMLDVPTMYADGGNGRGNYCVLNPLKKAASSITVLDGNLGISTSASNVGVAGTIGVSSSKWYWETTFTNSSGVPSIGAASATWDTSYVGYVGSIGYHANGIIYNNGSSVQSSLASYTSGDVIGVALDLDAGSIKFYKNNTQIGTTITGLTGEWFPAVAGQTSSTLAANFGQRPFAYTPPTGFKALNTQNLPDSTIKKGNQYFDATTYTGNGSTLAVTNSGSMQPDLVWIKVRNTAGSHVLQDSVRGPTAYLQSNATTAENTNTANDWFRSFNSNGFTVAGSTTGGTATTEWDSNGNTFVGWQWKESVSAGFDIVTYTGTGSNTTVAHNLGVAPKMMIVKQRNSANSWIVYQASLGATQYLRLETTAAAAAATSVWNDTSPTSSVFTVGTSGTTNGSAQTYVAYLFAEVTGYSKFGSYTGNGSTDGPFVYLGFRPKFVMVKRTNSTGNWRMWDASRSTYNVASASLLSNSSGAELTGSNEYFDILSNGFKLRSADSEQNASSSTYVYAAFAENPFKNSLAR